MNSNRLKILIFLLLPAVYLSAQNCKVKVYIRTDITSSKIYVADSLIGRGNTDIELTRGDYHISVMDESDRWNAKAFNDTLRIENCNDTTLTYTFKSEVYLNTEPQDVYVYQDSELIGHTPLFLPVNSQKVVLKKPGFEDRSLPPDELASGTKIILKFNGEPVNKSFFERNIFKILVGGIVALGGVTAYFKLKADNNFDKYLSSGDKYFLDQTNKYDLISGISFGALQISFGFLIYHFLSE